MNQTRNFSIDSMRVLLIVMIVTHHLLLRGEGVRQLEINAYSGECIYTLINAVLVCAVDVFFLISGYFKIKFKIRKIFKLIIAVYFFYYTINVLFYLFNDLSITTDILKGFVFPISKFWFVFVYVILSALSVWLNKLIDVLNTKELLYLCCVLFGIFCIYGFVVKDMVVGVNDGYSLNYAVFLYLTGALIRKNNYHIKKDNIIYGCGFSLFVLINIFIIYQFILANKYTYAWHMYSYNNPLVLGAAICLFLFFLNRSGGRIEYYLAKISRYVIYIYIFHSTKCMFEYIVKWFLLYKKCDLLSNAVLIVFFLILITSIGSVAGVVYEFLFHKIDKYI